VEEGVPGSGEIAFRFIGGGEVQPDVRRARIQRQSNKISTNGARAVGIFEVVLPKPAQEVPVTGVAWLKMDGALTPFAGLQGSKMNGERVSNAEVSETGANNEGNSDKCSALKGAGERRDHSTVLCLDRNGVAT
jgi:hypothetical protein